MSSCMNAFFGKSDGTSADQTASPPPTSEAPQHEATQQRDPALDFDVIETKPGEVNQYGGATAITRTENGDYLAHQAWDARGVLREYGIYRSGMWEKVVYNDQGRIESSRRESRYNPNGDRIPLLPSSP